ncbi:MAG: hypothetical protein LAT51_13240 [Flavobacteriaceae bacterium]|nr:hypothetical protein [Flavobacteriaceae bacterium]
MSALLIDDFDFVVNKILLLDDPLTQNLFKSYIAYENDEIDDFVKFGLESIQQEYERLNLLKQKILSMLVVYHYVIKDLDTIDLILRNYFKFPEKNATELEALVILNQVSLIKGYYEASKELLDLTEKFYPEEYGTISIIQAETFVALGYQYLAEDAAKKSLNYTEDQVNNLFAQFSLDYFEKYFKVIVNIEGQKIRVNLAQELLKKQEYKNKANLLMSLIYAPEDSTKSKAYFTKFTKNENQELLDIFEKLLSIDYELAQKNKNYKKINTNLSYLSDATSEVFFSFYQIKLQLIANYKSPDYEYDYNKILDILKNLKKQAASDSRLNETAELLSIIATYYVDKEKALDLLNNCQFCKYYDKESLKYAIQDDSKFLITNTLDSFEYIEDMFYNNFKHYLFLKLVEE